MSETNPARRVAGASRSPDLCIVEPSGLPSMKALQDTMSRLSERGHVVEYLACEVAPNDRLGREGAMDRARLLMRALTEADAPYILAARGGYGASEVLEHLDWPALEAGPRKVLIGFSDISALHAAFFHRLNWYGLHGPMPGSSQWQWGEDVTELLRLIDDGLPWRSAVPVTPLIDSNLTEIGGKLFGGCLSVLTNLIGTPFFPTNLRETVLFVEDVGESLPRLLRYWHQWRHCGIVEELRAIVLGTFSGPDASADLGPAFAREIAQRTAVPVFLSPGFGHAGVHFPICVGADAIVSRHELKWHAA
jgi:muramoyltetrapeptide carboxypeptidase